MPVELRKARDFVYQNGVLWERALYGYLFEGRSVRCVQQALQAYQNVDGGYGNALEHDIRCPDSHPLALEYLLKTLVAFGIPPADLLDETLPWLEANQHTDGSLRNPPNLLNYPHAPWWSEGGVTQPDSITGCLTKLGRATPAVAQRTRRWVQAHHTPESIRSNEWLFMAYRAYDYFMYVDDYPDVETYRQAVVDNVIDCARKAPEEQYTSFFAFAPTPDSRVARTAPDLTRRFLDYLPGAQQADGCWKDQHDLPQWFPITTITVLYTLYNYGRLKRPTAPPSFFLF